MKVTYTLHLLLHIAHFKWNDCVTLTFINSLATKQPEAFYSLLTTIPIWQWNVHTNNFDCIDKAQPNRSVSQLNNWYPKVTNFHIDIMCGIHRKTNEIIAITCNHIFRHARKFLIDYRLVFDSVDLVVWYFYTIFTHLVWNEHFKSLSMFKLIVFSFGDSCPGNGHSDVLF